nr:mycofactocin biosynthesis peptidyl-dipeptidase MftE [Nocardioides agariphilus]
MQDRALRTRVWPSVERGVTVLLPVGSVEQHGPHLPLDTDTVIACAVADGVAAALGEDVLVAPAVPYGASGEHQAFPGTSSVGTDVLARAVVELVRSMTTWAGRVLVVNGHGGNVAALRAATALLVEEGRLVEWHGCSAGWVDAHAGRTETSLMLHLAPESVRLEHAEAGNIEPIGALIAALTCSGVAAVSANGVLGDPAGASAEEGRRVLAAMVDDVSSAVLAGADS